MKYLIRSVKYFFYFAILSSAIVLALVLTGAVEGDINNIFEGNTLVSGAMVDVKFALYAC